MSLGAQLAPHLPFLRRFGRALTGNQEDGDRFVRATLGRITANPEAFPRDVEPRLGLYRLFLDVWERHQSATVPGNDADRELDAENIAHRRLASMDGTARLALLLTAMEGFTPEDAGWLIDRSKDQVERLVGQALAEIERQTKARIQIIEDEPMIAMDIDKLLREMGHDVVAVSTTHREATAHAREHQPGLILADIQLADNSSGIDAVNEIKATSRVPVIFVTAFPERLLTGNRPEPTFLITKPFQRATLKAAVSQALFFDVGTVPDDEDAVEEPALEKIEGEIAAPDLGGSVRALAREDLSPRLGPIRTELVHGQLRRASAPPVVSDLGGERIIALWRVQAENARRLADQLAGSNANRAFRARIDALARALATDPDDAAALAASVQEHGLRRLLPIVRDDLMDDLAADVEAFIDDLRDLAWHFGSYREFVGDARRATPLQNEERGGLIAAAQAIEAAPDRAVDPSLKADIAEVRQNAEQTVDAVSDWALVRVLGDVFKTIGRFIVRHARELAEASWTKFTEEMGGTLAVIATTVVTGGMVALLARFLPTELGAFLKVAAVGEVMRRRFKASKKEKE